MQRLTAILFGLLLAVPTLGQEARAADAQLIQKLKQLDRTVRQIGDLAGKRAAALKRFDRFKKAIAKARRLPAGPARRYRLRRLHAGAKGVATRLSGFDGKLRAAQKQLRATRRELLGVISKLSSARRKLVREALKRAGNPNRKHRALRIANVRIDPLDGPKAIEEKADLLKDSEEKLRKRIRSVERLINRLKEQRKLRNIAARVDEYEGLFGEGLARRRISRTRPTTLRATGGNRQDGTVPPGAFNTTEMDDDALAADPGTRPTTYVQVKDLLSPGTLAALRAAVKSDDPAVRLAALKKAKAELGRAAARLAARSKAFRARARTLRQKERGRSK